jgi:hypothetical protein
MKNSISKAREVLDVTRKTPRMFASSRESMLNRVATVMEMIEVDFVPTDFYVKHLGAQGSSYKSWDDPVDDDWARVVIDDALGMISEKESNE